MLLFIWVPIMSTIIINILHEWSSFSSNTEVSTPINLILKRRKLRSCICRWWNDYFTPDLCNIIVSALNHNTSQPLNWYLFRKISEFFLTAMCNDNSSKNCLGHIEGFFCFLYSWGKIRIYGFWFSNL